MPRGVTKITEKRIMNVNEACRYYGMTEKRMMALLKSDIGENFAILDGSIYRLLVPEFENYLSTHRSIPETPELIKRERTAEQISECKKADRPDAGVVAVAGIVNRLLLGIEKEIAKAKEEIELLLKNGEIN